LLGEFELPSYAKIHDQRRGLRQKIGFMATHRPLRAWIASVGALLAAAHGLPSNTSSAGAPLELSRRVLARRLQPVCFGGSLAAARSSILSLPPTLWSILRSALARAACNQASSSTGSCARACVAAARGVRLEQWNGKHAHPL
jgi:hypothetical protein